MDGFVHDAVAGLRAAKELRGCRVGREGSRRRRRRGGKVVMMAGQGRGGRKTCSPLCVAVAVVGSGESRATVGANSRSDSSERVVSVRESRVRECGCTWW